MYGFQVLNGSGVSVAGSDFPSLFFLRKGTLTIPRAALYEHRDSQIDAMGVVAPVAPEGGLVFYQCDKTLAHYKGRIYSNRAKQGSGYWPTVYPEIKIIYFVYAPFPSVNEGDMGVHVKDSSGNLTYSTTSKPLQIAGFLDSSVEHANFISRVYNPLDYTISTGLTGDLALLPLNLRLYWTSTQFSGGFTDYWRYMRTATIDSYGVISIGRNISYRARSSGGYGNYNYSPNADSNNTFLIADVSGL